jgi:hypothetical protein
MLHQYHINDQVCLLIHSVNNRLWETFTALAYLFAARLQHVGVAGEIVFVLMWMVTVLGVGCS